MPRTVAIDIDPKVLEAGAAAALHASEQATVHIAAEIRDEVDEIVDTLVKGHPLAYLVLSQVLEDGSILLPFATTTEGIREAYDILHNAIYVHGIESAVEVRGSWYCFYEGITPSTDKATGVYNEGESIALFPCSSGKGITGELVWPHHPRNTLGRGATRSGSDPAGPEARREVLRQHEQYLNALRASDVEAILELVSDDAQTAIRDYVNDTGTLVGLDSKRALGSFYQALFEKYEIRSVELLHRVTREWYVFAELRFTVGAREGAGAGQTYTFNTAEIFVPGHDGRFVVRIGHGTDPS